METGKKRKLGECPSSSTTATTIANDILIMNVGGARIPVSRQLIEKCTMMKAMFGGAMEPSVVMSDGSFFLEEDQCIFRNILVVLRSGDIPERPLYHVSKEALHARLLYWGIIKAEEEEGEKKGKEKWEVDLVYARDVGEAEFWDGIEYVDYVSPEDRCILLGAIHSVVFSLKTMVLKKIEVQSVQVSDRLSWKPPVRTRNGLQIKFQFNILGTDCPVRSTLMTRTAFVPQSVINKIYEALHADAMMTFVKQMMTRLFVAYKLPTAIQLDVSVSSDTSIRVVGYYTLPDPKWNKMFENHRWSKRVDK